MSPRVRLQLAAMRNRSLPDPSGNHFVERARFITALRLVLRPSAAFALRTRAAPPLPSFLPA